MAKASGKRRTLIEHRDPTESTVKLLYGTALGCAAPGCRAPLYRASEEAGARALNSRVAHIHARSEEGPRWDPLMSEDDNRHADNLLILCIFHASEIDQFPDTFPAELLRSWKRTQLAEHEHAQTAWAAMTDAEAAEALTPANLQVAIARFIDVIPFNPRMRSRAEAWQHAARQGRSRRWARLTPLVAPDRRNAVLEWMTSLDTPIVGVPKGQVRVLVARMGAGKTEQAMRWWDQALLAAADNQDVQIPIYLHASRISPSLEQAIIAEIGTEPSQERRIVVDNLDGVPDQQAARFLQEARELVHVWPNLSILATARPGMMVAPEEVIEVQPWPVSRGAELVEVAINDQMPFHLLRTAETADLLTSPLSALALANRLHTGRDAEVSRAQLFSDLAETAIDSSNNRVSDDTWNDMASLAARILGQAGPVAISTFQPAPRMRRLLATDLVIAEAGNLSFALPVFEHYFGAQAIRSRYTPLSAAASSTAFPRWRYALAFAVASAPPTEQESLLVELAGINPAAVFWILDEVADKAADNSFQGPSDYAIAELIQRRSGPERTSEPSLAIRAGAWIRDAENRLLAGLGPLATSIAQRGDGTTGQWGVWLTDGYLAVARSRKRTPPPDVVMLDEANPDLPALLANGFYHWTPHRFPTSDFGRWLIAQNWLRERVENIVRRRVLPVPSDSWLARERAYFLSEFVYNYGASRRSREIPANDLREKVAEWMERVRSSKWSTWSGSSVSIDSDDVRWLSSQLETRTEHVIEAPWPDGDVRNHGKWTWQTYSPDLTLAIATGVVREALVGYRLLVEKNFPTFGDALGLYSMFPVHVEGLVARFSDADDNVYSVAIHMGLRPAGGDIKSIVPAVDLQLVTERHDGSIWQFQKKHLRQPRTTFGQNPLQSLDLPLNVPRAATNIAYGWLAQDLAAIGWLNRDIRIFD